ncbi:MAG: hypothetical protein ABF384_14360 [Verrucomicrobiales bacterium]
MATGIIIVMGLANLLADGFSMAADNFSGTRAENQSARRHRRRPGLGGGVLAQASHAGAVSGIGSIRKVNSPSSLCLHWFCGVGIFIKRKDPTPANPENSISANNQNGPCDRSGIS